MAGFLIPLAGLALGAIGRLMTKRRQQRALQGAQGSAHGTAINTQPQGPPTSAVSQAATTSPTLPTTPTASRGPRQTGAERGAEQQRHEAEKLAQRTQGQSTLGGTPQTGTAPDTSGLAAQMGKESAARARKRNLQQQATLSGAATRS